MARFIVGVIFASIFGAAGFGLILTAAIAFEGALQGALLGVGFALFLLVLPFFLLFSLRTKPKYEKALYSLLAPLLLESSRYESLSFLSKKEAFASIGRFSRALGRSLDSEGHSAFTGTIKGISFFTALAESEMGVSKTTKRNTGISVRLIEYRMPKPFATDVLVRAKVVLPVFKKVNLQEKIATESIAFDNRYEAFAKDSFQGRLFLTPVRIDGIVSLNREMEGFVNVYFHEDSVLVFFERYESPFHLGLTRKVDEAFLQDFRRELLIPYRVFKALDLSS